MVERRTRACTTADNAKPRIKAHRISHVMDPVSANACLTACVMAPPTRYPSGYSSDLPQLPPADSSEHNQLSVQVNETVLRPKLPDTPGLAAQSQKQHQAHWYQQRSREGVAVYRVFEALDELGAIVEEARGVPMTAGCRSEERRVGKECRSRG